MSPVRSALRDVLRRPALILAEIAWRWAFGAAAWAIITYSIGRILRGVDVSEAEILIARRSDAFLIADAVARIIAQVLPAFTRLLLVLAPALALLWAIAATAGRAATLKVLLEPQQRPAHAISLFWLNVIRAVFTLAALAAFFGTFVLSASIVSSAPNDPSRPGISMMIWTVLSTLVLMFWALVNWFLSLAPIWIVRDGRGPLAAIAESVSLYRRHSSAYFSAACAFGLLRSLLFMAAFALALIAAAIGSAANTVTALLATILVSLAYFAVADYLAVARVAAFLLLDSAADVNAVSRGVPGPEPQPVASDVQNLPASVLNAGMRPGPEP